MKDSSFFALVLRMKHIDRWGLMRNTFSDNLAEHSLDTTVIAHCLCVIGNTYFNKNLNAERCALLALYHDTPEIITGDMPTPVKYYSETLRSLYKDIEKEAQRRLISLLPDDMKDEYDSIFSPGEELSYEKKLVKGADKLSAYIKCIEEEKAGNREFLSAEETTLRALKEMGLPEVDIFIEECIPGYRKTLDELRC